MGSAFPRLPRKQSDSLFVSCFDTQGSADSAGTFAPSADSWGQQTAHAGEYESHMQTKQSKLMIPKHPPPKTKFLHPGHAPDTRLYFI